ncbi:MAG: hypothetical protein WCF90_11100, partial [Methanomicrobiales archaeon]
HMEIPVRFRLHYRKNGPHCVFPENLVGVYPKNRRADSLKSVIVPVLSHWMMMLLAFSTRSRYCASLSRIRHPLCASFSYYSRSRSSACFLLTICRITWASSAICDFA